MNAKDRKTLIKTLHIFLLFFVIIGGIVSGLASAFYRSEIHSIFTRIKMQETLTVTLQNKVIGEIFNEIASDLFFLTQQNELKAFFNTADTNWLRGVESEYVAMSQRKGTYDQLRYLDGSGKERVRVNYNNGVPNVVVREGLQDKSNRYYFSDAIVLNREEVFVSPLDLNVENGEIEKPLKPMIRFATPVYDAMDSKRGVLLINYLADALLADIERAGELAQGSVMLVNAEGYWLLNSENSDTEWGFMFQERGNLTVAAKFPEEWSTIKQTKSGQFETNNGLFTYSTTFPLTEALQRGTGGSISAPKSTIANDSSKYYWVILSHIHPEVISSYKNSLLIKLFLFGAGVFVFIALGSWFAALAIMRRRIYQSELVEMATRDTLTKLPNRRECYEKLQSAVLHASRFNHKLGVVFIDLDGFKEVNDTKGHDVGDELLIQVSEILTSIFRSSDTVARLGGDEFVCVLSEIDSAEGAMHAGQKLIDALSHPIELTCGAVSIGASIGVSVYPVHGTDPETLLKNADSAMYASKAGGKNTCSMFSE